MKVLQNNFHITWINLLDEKRKSIDDNNEVYFKKFSYLNSWKLWYAWKDLCLFLWMVEWSDDYYYVVLQENWEFLLVSWVWWFEIQKFKYDDEYLNQRLEFESYQEFYGKLKDSIFDYSQKKIESRYKESYKKEIDDYVMFISEVQCYYQFVFKTIQEKIKEKFWYTIDFMNCTMFYNSVKQYWRNILHDKENLVLDII